MTNEIAVKVSGSIVAALHFEHVNSTGDQEGFLLGELITRVTRAISDSHLAAEKAEEFIHIYTIVPCDEEAFSFYDSAGQIQEEKLNHYLKGRRKDVIGWYRFRRNTSLEISLREQAVHKTLFQVLGRSPEYYEYFLFGIFTSCSSHNSSTYAFDQILMRYTDLGFERFSWNIINLGSTSHAEYLTYPHDATNIYAGTFKDIVNTVNIDGVSSVSHILDMHKALRGRLESVKEEVITSEDIVGLLCEEILELENQIKALRDVKNKEDSTSSGQQEDQDSEEDINEEQLLASSPQFGPSGDTDLKLADLVEENLSADSVGTSNLEIQNVSPSYSQEKEIVLGTDPVS